ncbi:MAG: hypothetical protein LBJ15_22325 [Comamonas sp.]|jgi:hypothetical protein|uniref:hypothetical protein n=1 Tax=Comamonas sp. TaxID=34028 RepID=UPI002830606B|nr:hypothetical protein [Comamonas sp.]MDR0216721.1 hypothetical protein [Comamonas sp.]
MMRKNKQIPADTPKNEKNIKVAKPIGPLKPTFKDKFFNSRDNFKKFYLSLNTSQRLYFYTFLLLILHYLGKILLTDETSKSTLIIFICQLTFTVIYDLLKIYKSIYNTIIGKSVLMIIFSLGVTFSLAISSQLINAITGIDPLKFPRALAFLSIMMIPVFLIPSLLAIQMLLIAVSPILFFLYSITNGNLEKVITPEKENTEKIKFNGATKLIQFTSVLIFFALIYSFGNKSLPAYNKFLEKSASWFIFNLEMYPRAQCQISEGKRAAFISDQVIAVGSREGNHISLTLQECK